MSCERRERGGEGERRLVETTPSVKTLRNNRGGWLDMVGGEGEKVRETETEKCGSAI